jgi:hypothetical protein
VNEPRNNTATGNANRHSGAQREAITKQSAECGASTAGVCVFRPWLEISTNISSTSARACSAGCSRGTNISRWLTLGSRVRCSRWCTWIAIRVQQPLEVRLPACRASCPHPSPGGSLRSRRLARRRHRNRAPVMRTPNTAKPDLLVSAWTRIMCRNSADRRWPRTNSPQAICPSRGATM